jgi:hypothetical protein
MTPNQKKFCSDITDMAKQLTITPEYALACFGVVAAGMVMFTVVKKGGDRQESIDAAVGLFTDNLLEALKAFESK